MRRILVIFGLGLVCILGFSHVTIQAQSIENVADEFYGGLATVIERNMDNPEQCVKEVDDYYKSNQDKVVKMREATSKAMERIAPEMDKYMSMSDEELEDLEKKAVERAKYASQPQISESAKRYTNAMQSFTMKHPQYAIMVASKAMQLLPTSIMQDQDKVMVENRIE